jgi:hypothetical protein
LIALRCVLLLLVAGTLLMVLGAASSDVQPSTRRLCVAAAFGLLAPLFWPGSGTSARQTVARILGWSFGAGALAALTMVWLDPAPARWTLLAPSCGMLVAMLVSALAALALLEGWMRGVVADPAAARSLAGRTVTLALALAGSLPLWLGPTAELLSHGSDAVIDAVIGWSPLTHLAVASGNDLLRNQWFYQQSNLATLQFNYPAAATLAGAYAATGVILILAAWRAQSHHPIVRRASLPPRTPNIQETLP